MKRPIINVTISFIFVTQFAVGAEKKPADFTKGFYVLNEHEWKRDRDSQRDRGPIGELTEFVQVAYLDDKPDCEHRLGDSNEDGDGIVNFLARDKDCGAQFVSLRWGLNPAGCVVVIRGKNETTNKTVYIHALTLASKYNEKQATLLLLERVLEKCKEVETVSVLFPYEESVQQELSGATLLSALGFRPCVVDPIEEVTEIRKKARVFCPERYLQFTQRRFDLMPKRIQTRDEGFKQLGERFKQLVVLGASLKRNAEDDEEEQQKIVSFLSQQLEQVRTELLATGQSEEMELEQAQVELRAAAQPAIETTCTIG
jgi:hypothetical protein